MHTPGATYGGNLGHPYLVSFLKAKSCTSDEFSVCLLWGFYFGFYTFIY